MSATAVFFLGGGGGGYKAGREMGTSQTAIPQHAAEKRHG